MQISPKVHTNGSKWIQQWDLSDKSLDDICSACQKAVRVIFNLPYRTHKYLPPHVVGCDGIRDNLIGRFKNFFNH